VKLHIMLARAFPVRIQASDLPAVVRKSSFQIRPTAPEPVDEPDDTEHIEIEEIPDEESEDDEEYVD